MKNRVKVDFKIKLDVASCLWAIGFILKILMS